MNLLGRVVPGSIQRDECGVVDPAPRLEEAMLAQRLVDLIIHRIERLGLDGIEHVANLVVAGDLCDLKEAGGVVLSLRLLHGLLMGQKGGALGEEHREGAQTKILHVIGEVLARTAVWQSRQHTAQAPDHVFERSPLHAFRGWDRKFRCKGLRRISLLGP